MYTVCKIRCQSRKSPGISAGYRALPPLRRAGWLLHAIAGYVSFVPCWRKSRRGACHVLGRPLLRSPPFHAPFEDVWPGARDEEARRFAVRRIEGAIALAPVFRPAGIVLHGGYYDWLFDFQPEKWFVPARRSFGELAEAAEKAGNDLFVGKRLRRG